MSEYTYHLEPYKGMKSRIQCPKCGARGKFALYINQNDGEYLGSHVGRCERIESCGYHYTPKEYFQDNGIVPNIKFPQTTNKPKIKDSPGYISKEVLESSLSTYENNHFITYLIKLFGMEETKELIIKYHIGTSKYWKGSTVFWQVDILGKVRTGKIMLYKPSNGKRVREPFNHIQWAHKALKTPNFNLIQCLFGEHLIKGNNKPIAIVESEKSAIISSLYFPQFIWLACGSIQGLNKSKCEPLRGRNVVLFPDLNALPTWKDKAKELKDIVNVTVSTFLEENATDEEISQGLDIADFLIQHKLSDYRSESNSKLNDLKVWLKIIAETEPDLSPLVNQVILNPLKYENGIRDIYRTMHERGYGEFEGKY